MAFNKFLVVLLLLTVATIANARVDFLNKVSDHVSLSADTDLECCDDCRCDVSAGSCTCTDWVQGACTSGCFDCECLVTSPHFCRCKDTLDSCPRTCRETLTAALKAQNSIQF